MIYLIFRILFSPKVAASFVTSMSMQPELKDDLVAICHRESRCTPYRVHERDSWLSRREYLGQVKLGHLDPGCQEYRPGEWATRGAWGLSAASHWKYMPSCYDPSWFDVPLVSAYVALKKYNSKCKGKGLKSGWCRVPRRVLRDNRKRRSV